MKKYAFLLLLSVISMTNAQNVKGPKIGYFDMMLILKSMPEFAEANNQLELRVQEWKKEIDQQQAHINLLIDELNSERILLTKELIEEKENEIAYLQNELSAYQQKRFGPTGDLFTQKTVLIKPIQDQVFTIVNDIAERRKYDFVYDMSSAANGLVYANQRFDMNEEIINALNRASKREEAQRKRMSKEEEQAEDDKKYDPDMRAKEEARQQKLDERQQKINERKEKIKQQKEERNNQQKNNKNTETEQTEEIDEEQEETDTPKRLTQEERKAQLEARKQQILEQREAQKKKKAEALEQKKKELEERKNKIKQKNEQNENEQNE